MPPRVTNLIWIVRAVVLATGDVSVKAGTVGVVVRFVTSSTTVRHAVSLNGTLGHEARAFREYTYPWDSSALFVMHSDGLGSRWSLEGYRGLRQKPPSIVAAVLYRDFSRQRDDVTVVVGREVVM